MELEYVLPIRLALLPSHQRAMQNFPKPPRGANIRATVWPNPSLLYASLSVASAMMAEQSAAPTLLNKMPATTMPVQVKKAGFHHGVLACVLLAFLN